MKDVVITLLYFSLLGAYLGFLAWLIKSDADGWGWYAFIGFLIVGSIKVSVT